LKSIIRLPVIIKEEYPIDSIVKSYHPDEWYVGSCYINNEWHLYWLNGGLAFLSDDVPNFDSREPIDHEMIQDGYDWFDWCLA
jgi:hypothetical protein